MKNTQNEWSRRQFIATLTGASAAMLIDPFSFWVTDEIDPKIAAIVAKTIGIGLIFLKKYK
jgi:membrane dipeptidase